MIITLIYLNNMILPLNSLAMDIETGEIIDYFGGQEDLKNGILRHVSEYFAEDPIRVLRCARFNARYSNFTIHKDTIKLMKSIMSELEYVTPERIWLEIEKGVKETDYNIMFNVLHNIGCLELECLKFINYNAITSLSKNIKEYIKNNNVSNRKAFELKMITILYNNSLTEKQMNELKIPSHIMQIIKSIQFFNDYRLRLYEHLDIEEKVTILDRLRLMSNPKYVFKISHYFDIVFKENITPFIIEDYKKLKTIDNEKLIFGVKDKSKIKQIIFDAKVKCLDWII